MARRPTRDERKRIPPGSPRLKLSVENLSPGHRGYWAKKEQFEELEAAGYSFVKKEQDIVIGTERSKGTDLGNLVSRDGGGGERLYLMEIKKEWYEENQAYKQDEVDSSEKAIFEPKNDNQYISEQDVKNNRLR